MKMWSEARCDFVKEAGPDLFDDLNCDKAAPGAFGVAEATRNARRHGWIIAKRKWVCPKCRTRMEGQGVKFRGARK